MAFYKKKPEVIEAITFKEFVAYSKESTEPPHWFIPYRGINISHENDEKYIVPIEDGTQYLTSNDMLVTDSKGITFVVDKISFDKRYDSINKGI